MQAVVGITKNGIPLLSRNPKKHKISCVVKIENGGGRNRARAMLHDAVARGWLTRPDTCEICGCESRKITAHHKNYGFPLDVIWCCRLCHDVLDGMGIAKQTKEQQ